MRKSIFAGAVAAGLLATGVAYAQAPSKSASDANRGSKIEPRATAPKKTGIPAAGPAMQVHIVRSSDPKCEPTCSEWIAAQGRIDTSTPRNFKKVFGQLGTRKLPILIDSAGGSVDEALAIGRLIRAKGLDVVVTKTEFTACAPTDAACETTRKAAKAKGIVLGRPKSHASRCASSCAFVLAGGKRRFVGPMTFAGVHQLTTFETRVKVLRTYRVETRREWGVPVETRKTLVSEKRLAEKTTMMPTASSMYDRVRLFFAEMGIGDGVMTALLATPNTSIHWFSRDELQRTKLATDLVDGEKVLAGLASVVTSTEAERSTVGRAAMPTPGPGSLTGEGAALPGR